MAPSGFLIVFFVISLSLNLNAHAMSTPSSLDVSTGLCREEHLNITSEMKSMMTRCNNVGMQTTGQTWCTPLCLMSGLGFLDKTNSSNLGSTFIKAVFPGAMVTRIEDVINRCVAKHGQDDQILPIEINDCSNFQPLMQCATNGVKQVCGGVKRETRDPFSIIAAVALGGALAELSVPVIFAIAKNG